MKRITILAVMALMLASCTENQIAKNYGGTMTVEIPKGQKFVNATWKETQLWYVTKDMSSSDSAETYYFHEKSSWGISEGTVIFKETK
jgi:hypothetical protein